ncbi:MAG: hypothetical protein LBK77_03660 [Spirochaetaceae bacterium]|jgi:glycine betaine/choline ABC-type transport system substrate-binding protein|nr:hypothetical protein [Spirochaetaceae bacterium]
MKTRFVCLLAAGILLFSCRSKGTVVLGSIASGDALTVSEIYAEVLEKNGYKVSRSFDFDITSLHEAIVNETVDIGVEWTGAALTKVLGAPRGGDQYGTFNALNARYKQTGLALFEPLPADNAWTFAVLRETAEGKNIKTFSDLQKAAGELTLAVSEAFNSDNEGFLLLETVYGPFRFKELRVVSEEEQHSLLHGKAVDVISLRSGDGHFADAEHKKLRDNFHAFVPQNLVPVARDEFLSAHEDIRSLLNAVSASLNDKVMIGLDAKTSIEKIPYPRAAKDYIKENSF